MNTLRLPNASYKGFEFVWRSNSTQNQAKKVLHEYPNRDRGFIEYLGLSIKTFSLECEVFNTLDNDAFEEFENILTKGMSEAGNLVLPMRGTIKDIEVISWSTREDKNILGYIPFVVEFAQTSANQYPTTTKSNTGYIDRLKDKLLGDNTTKFTNAWNGVKNKKQQTEKALSKVRSSGHELQKVARQISGASGILSDFVNTTNVLINNTTKLVQSPSLLAQQIQLSFESLEDTIDNARNLFGIVGGYFNFNAGDDNAIGNGNIQREIQENQNAINNVIKTNAIAIGYVIATLIEYETLQELNEFREQLQNAYDSLPENIDIDIQNTLEEIQVNANLILDAQVLTLPTLKTIEVVQQPLAILVYSLYGNLDLYEDIYNINNIQNANAVHGNIIVYANI